MTSLYVREDDTMVCRDCYEDEGGDHAARPMHRELHARVHAGSCENCGRKAGFFKDDLANCKETNS